MRTAAKPRDKFRLHSMGRWFKYKYVLLIRAKGGPAMVAMGFSIGLFVEMFTLPTAGLAFFLIFPLVYVLRGSVAAALIGFVFGKVIYIPFSFLHREVGGLVMPHRINGQWLQMLPHWLDSFIRFNLKLFVGGVIDGLVLGLIVYFPIRWALEWFHQKRKEKRQRRKEQLLPS
ncbi:hypothetical protein SAMN02799630_02447 [Paenibacillus sp. UNCCL117]|uniref:DUF2062 domain-containing protein n=1 Tax=unclassified Paenibacillus TaxID=185978 RepID=UPI000888C1D0|nr:MULTISPECIES: DUF2062 domain-containing protein [unclassified Paenibacillus]SDC01985.1 hypothetical protein SAMN04488602_101115 [Paenibacillus sp. cl123]SFW36750.1 hypothetical protein SAMN02799630_02447 [Paenibacillus sp. UNCCL117]